MRRLLVAPLLLSGCTLLGPTIPSDAGSSSPHDGYVLRCGDVPRPDCERIADELAERHRAEREEEIVSITLRPDGKRSVCWASTAGTRCLTSIA